MTRIGDTTMAAVEYALRGLELRADVHADNIANLNTPGFRAQQVDFESALRGALAGGDPRGASAPSPTPGAGLADPTGNTVDPETELIGLMKDNLLRDAMVNAYNFKTGVLRTAITGR